MSQHIINTWETTVNPDEKHRISRTTGAVGPDPKLYMNSRLEGDEEIPDDMTLFASTRKKKRKAHSSCHVEPAEEHATVTKFQFKSLLNDTAMRAVGSV